MTIVGMMRVKNEARWIEQNVRSLFPLCERVFMLNDHSTDGTEAVCRAIPGVTVLDSPFNTMNEVRDKNFLLKKIQQEARPDWIIQIDGDEQLPRGDQDKVRQTIASGRASVYSFHIDYLWNDASTVRRDGVYGTFQRPSMWKTSTANGARFVSRYASNFHCTNVPAGAGRFYLCEVRLWHFGYMHLEDRLRKHAWYNRHDPGNKAEDCYRHVIQGDPGGPPAHERLLHAGPLRLERISNA